MAITQKLLVGISSNFLHSIRTSICIRKCNKNWGPILSHFFEKSMGYIVQGNFQKLAHFLKMAITQKLLVGISSNFLHSIRTSICIRKCNKNRGGGGDFGNINACILCPKSEITAIHAAVSIGLTYYEYHYNTSLMMHGYIFQIPRSCFHFQSNSVGI